MSGMAWRIEIYGMPFLERGLARRLGLHSRGTRGQMQKMPSAEKFHDSSLPICCAGRSFDWQALIAPRAGRFTKQAIVLTDGMEGGHVAYGPTRTSRGVRFRAAIKCKADV